MKKKILAITLCIAMLAIAIVGGTLAYFTDNDSATNVMTVGNVKIEQNEQQRGEDGELEGFEQNKVLIPAVLYDDEGNLITDYDNWYVADYSDPIEKEDGTINYYMPDQDNIHNMIDKVVTVTNTGSRPAYVRTIFLFQDNEEYSISENVAIAYDEWFAPDDYFMVDDTTYAVIEIDGVQYTACIADYAFELAAGETSLPSLMSFWMNPQQEQDGVFGGTYQIIAVSQAVQSEGFNSYEDAMLAAYGENTVENLITWLGEVGYTATWVNAPAA